MDNTTKRLKEYGSPLREIEYLKSHSQKYYHESENDPVRWISDLTQSPNAYLQVFTAVKT